MRINHIIGLVLILLGIGMFILGGWIFTYHGHHLSSIVNNLGMYSFFLWLPVLITGIVFLFISIKTSK